MISIKKVIRVLLIIILLAATLLFPLLLNSTAAAALIFNSEENSSAGFLNPSDHDMFLKLGSFMLMSSVLMIISTILCVSKKSIPAVIIELAGTVILFSAVIKLILVVDASGVTNSELIPLSDVYALRHFPTAVHTLLIFLISLADHFSNENTKKKTIEKGN